MNTLTVRPATELDELLTAVRGAVARGAGWHETASYVGDALREHLPSPGLLPADLLSGERGTYRSHRLHVEPDGSFSMAAIAWQPGALTRIHDHVTWCVFGVLTGVEYEDLFTLSEDGTALIEAGHNPNTAGEVSAFAPPGDIHRVRNIGEETAVSLHIYGTDLNRVGSSARRFYDLPVQS
ncbi:cysteine dioxygenase family protein [Actinomadura viridis]|uniref:Metal-dependent enzyme (Double-stranded beta helix superfamily) n=1 Tax=Actinomadura viridis TaxID=58110 RepID=A0A931DUT5_9ACTN|nr:cysteine dioxygenase family protein [Actinomadura viridis]MBG6093990.1 putative metal-dependent enzyme (double-stranded beta helix superfamily) [Actinomadura viridis]